VSPSCIVGVGVKLAIFSGSPQNVILLDDSDDDDDDDDVDEEEEEEEEGDDGEDDDDDEEAGEQEGDADAEILPSGFRIRFTFSST
jgi:hypothetical protein